MFLSLFIGSFIHLIPGDLEATDFLCAVTPQTTRGVSVEESVPTTVMLDAIGATTPQPPSCTKNEDCRDGIEQRQATCQDAGGKKKRYRDGWKLYDYYCNNGTCALRPNQPEERDWKARCGSQCFEEYKCYVSASGSGEAVCQWYSNCANSCVNPKVCSNIRFEGCPPAVKYDCIQPTP